MAHTAHLVEFLSSAFDENVGWLLWKWDSDVRAIDRPGLELWIA